MTNVLRNEWGFVGYAITDFNLYNYMYPDMGVAAGTDLMLTFTPMKSMADTTSATSVTNMRNAMHNILYTVANSNAMNGIAPGADMVYHMATWRVVQIAVDVVLGVLYVAAIAWVVVRVKKHKNDPVDAADNRPQGLIFHPSKTTKNRHTLHVCAGFLSSAQCSWPQLPQHPPQAKPSTASGSTPCFL